MTTKRKNLDYSASAVNLVNPPEVQVDLSAYTGLTLEIDQVKTEMDACIPQGMKDRLATLEIQLLACLDAVKADIERFGSYQDFEAGLYAVKQRRESIIYTPALVRKHAPDKVADFVLVLAVDGKALEALAKAGQIDGETLRKCGEVKESFAFIIRAETPGKG